METPVYGIIYCLLFPNGCYIGQTIQGENIRWKEHLRDTKAGSTLPVHNAIRKHYNKNETQNNVKRIIIDKAYSLEELNKLEKIHIKNYNTFNDNGNNPNGYNMTMGGDGCLGYKYTKKQKEDCSKTQQKRKVEQPEISIKQSIYMKQRAHDDPNIGIQQGIVLRQFYCDNPSKRKDMSNIKKQQYKNNPEMAIQQSEIKLMQFQDKDAVERIKKIKNKSIQQWQDPEKKRKIMDEKRNRFSKPFNVYKDGILIGSFDYVPDCAFTLFGKKNDSNISAVLAGRKKLHKGYVFEYKL